MLKKLSTAVKVPHFSSVLSYLSHTFKKKKLTFVAKMLQKKWRTQHTQTPLLHGNKLSPENQWLVQMHFLLTVRPFLGDIR